MTKTLATAVTVAVRDDDGNVIGSKSYKAGDELSVADAKSVANPAAFDMAEWSRDSVTFPDPATTPVPDPGNSGSPAPDAATADEEPAKRSRS